MVPREVQLRLDEPSDDELLRLLRAISIADEEAGFGARDAITTLYRSLDRDTELRVLARVRQLREQVRDERRPP